MSPKQSFADAYIEAALWSSTYETAEGDDNYMDDGQHELAPVTLQSMRDSCAAFQREFRMELAQAYEHLSYSEAQAGHDFWLTRNGHGGGFWDRGLGHIGHRLAEAAKKYGERGLYIGDDGLVYQS